VLTAHSETDDVRMATGVPSGTVVQSIATFCFCLGLALYKQWALTLVTLSAVPLMVLLNVVTQALVHPMYSVERRAFAEASTEVERSTSAISTVKAFNAQDIELGRFYRLTTAACDSLRRQATVWAVCLGGSQAIMLSMFVIGFWYGSKLVAEGTTSVATVMTVFWATLLASGNLQSIVPQLSFITKGKMSLASLLTVIQDEETDDSVGGSRSSNNTFFGTTRISTVSSVTAKVRNRPARCRGEFDFRDVRFAYPSRPDVRVLRGITLFLPAGETTFIVGGSGSGKSTVAQLLLRLYKPNSGEIVLDTKSFDNIPEDFTREHIAAVQQGCILFDMSVHDNVAMGVVGAGRNWLGRYRDHTDISRDEVIEACKMAFIHDFIMSLPHGYDTKLGTGGSLLSGGQRQRLAIARARIRDPTVLILGKFHRS
jgi:ATP-binding cassette subfamily B (MDR/TAP) protein 1